MEDKDGRTCKRARAACIGLLLRPRARRCLLAAAAAAALGLLALCAASGARPLGQAAGARGAGRAAARAEPARAAGARAQAVLADATGAMLARWVAAAAAANRTLWVLEVGACNGDFAPPARGDDGAGGSTTPRESNDVVQGLFGSPAVRAVLVEPNPPMFRELQRNMAAAFGNTERLRAMQVAVCPEKSGSVPFYVVDSERLVRDHPDTPKWAAKQLSSMDRHHIVKHARSLAMKRSAWEAYIQEIAVPCLTPADLLAAASLPPSQVDLLQVDAEGFDGKIVRTFLNLPEVNPKVIRFEQKHLPRQELGNLTSYLRARGYRVEQISSDVVAWREAELQIDGPRLQAPVAETHPPTRTALPCPEYVRVAGVPTAQSKRNGMFKQIGVIKEEGVIMNGGRPVFRSTNKQFLFYFARRKSWRIGNQPEAGQDGFGDGVISQDGEGAVCPTNASGWHYFDGGWVPSSAITVEAAINVAPSQSKS